MENLIATSEENGSPYNLTLTVSFGELCPLDSVSTQIYFLEHHEEDTEHFRFKGINDGVATVTINGGGRTCEVQVIVGNGGIENVTEGRFVVQNTSINLKMGETGQIIVESAPAGYTLADAVFTSTDPEVATVDQNGNVTAGNKGGSAVIYISTVDGEYTGACIINVS